MPKALKTIDAAKISDVIVSKNSTAGVQALFMGKFTLYLDAPGSKYTNFFIQKNWVSQIFSKEEFAKKVPELLNAKNKKKDFLEVAGIPKDSAEKMAEVIRKSFK